VSSRGFVPKKGAAFLMTERNQEAFAFTAHFSRRVQAEFTVGRVSSDGGRYCFVRQTAGSIFWAVWALF
jgi:hypothetical protein